MPRLLQLDHREVSFDHKTLLQSAKGPKEEAPPVHPTVSITDDKAKVSAPETPTRESTPTSQRVHKVRPELNLQWPRLLWLFSGGGCGVDETARQSRNLRMRSDRSVFS